MNETANNRKLELHSRIEELEDSLVRLKNELKKEEQDEQHAAIDELEVYLEAIDHKYESLRDFWSIVVTEPREIFDGITSENESIFFR